jgi:hypothetical protein
MKMYLVLASALLASMMFGASAQAAGEGTGGDVSAAKLVEFCQVSKSDSENHASIAFCYGYIDAALGYHAAVTSGPAFDPLTCPPNTVTREQVALVIVEWADANSSKLSDDSPVDVVMQAVSEKWPCPAQ